MKPEEVLRWIVNLCATLLLVWGLKTEFARVYMFCAVILAVSYICLYNRSSQNPKNVPWFNTTISYLAFCCFMAVPGLMSLAQNITSSIVALLTVTGLLCLLDAYVPVIVYQLGYRSANKPRYPATMLVFIIAIFFAAVMIN